MTADHDALASEAFMLAIDLRAAEVTEALEREGISCILLKGRGLADWLYPSGGRRYTDVDVLVSPSDRRRAGEVLEAFGYAQSPFESLGGHATCYMRDHDPVGAVDLHWTFHHMGCDPALVWARTLRDAVEIDLLGHAVRVPGRVMQALMVALHAVRHGIRGGQQAEDLRRVVAAELNWHDVRELAAELGATIGLAAGLRMLPAGAVLADRLALPTDIAVELRLQSSSPPPTAGGFLALSQARGSRAKLAILARELAPPPIQMKEHVGLASRGAAGLALSYALRPAWLLRHAPSGWRAWRAASAAPIVASSSAADASASPAGERSST